MTIELVEPDDFPRTGTRAEINGYLERFYNANAARNTYVPYGFWEKGGTREIPDPPQETLRADASGVSQATRDLVLAHLCEASGRAEVAVGHQLSKDLGFDSLATAELVTWLQTEFGFSVDTPESLNTVADVVLAAAGQGVSAKASDLKASAARLVLRRGESDGPDAAARRHPDGCVPEAGGGQADAAALRGSGERHPHVSRPGDGRHGAEAAVGTAGGELRGHHDACVGRRHRLLPRGPLRRQDARDGELDDGLARAAPLARHAGGRRQSSRPERSSRSWACRGSTCRASRTRSSSSRTCSRRYGRPTSCGQRSGAGSAGPRSNARRRRRQPSCCSRAARRACRRPCRSRTATCLRTSRTS